MKITIAAATRFEIDESLLQNTQHDIRFLYTGVGILASAVSLTHHVLRQDPQLIIQAGIAGSFNTNISLGETVVVEKECLGDTGVLEQGIWKDLFDMRLLDDNADPFVNRQLINENVSQWKALGLKNVNGVTVNQITASIEQRDLLKMKYNADIESMEGVSLHYVCLLFSIPFIQMRSVSNYVCERDKKNWKLKESIGNVNEAVRRLIDNCA